ncbi:MAG: alpha/beta hydrolase [Chitinophagaceae bacterium]
MKWWMKFLLTLVVAFVAIYFLGPNPKTPIYSEELPDIPSSVTGIEHYISEHEKRHNIKPNNQARIVWLNDSLKQETEYALVYLHGFSASQEEGNPVHRTIAKMFGFNLYLARLAEHGIDTTDQLIQLTPEKYWESAKEALMIGKQLGKKIILMGTSTGGTQALQLAATYPNLVHALILYSPNIEINDPNAWLLNNPWGLQIARKVKNSNFIDPEDERPIYKQYWNKPYRLEAAVALQEMLETTMTKENLNRIKQPTLALYYYKDEKNQDPVVRVDAIKKMMVTISTTSTLKRVTAMPNPEAHVLASPI